MYIQFNFPLLSSSHSYMHKGHHSQAYGLHLQKYFEFKTMVMIHAHNHAIPSSDIRFFSHSVKAT